MTYSFSNYIWLLVGSLFAFTTQSPTLVDSTPKTKLIKWSVQKSSTLQIQGSTNLSSFGCDIPGYYHPDTIYCSEENTLSKLVTLKGDLEIDISKFDCHNKMLTNDLRKTLKADQYPVFVIRFLSLERAPRIEHNKDFLRGWVEIQLAGVCRRFEVCYSFIQTGSSLIQLNGKRSFNFDDFKLTPPKKLAGLIKVKNKFNVDFNLLLDPIK